MYYNEPSGATYYRDPLADRSNNVNTMVCSKKNSVMLK